MFNAWFPVSGTVWEEVGGVTSLKELCHWGWALRLQNPTPVAVSSQCLVAIVSRCEHSATVSTPCLPTLSHILYHGGHVLTL